MIDDPYPDDWKELQEGVRRILRNIGMHAEVEAKLKTPRGSTTVDVFAVDVGSVDKIRYIVECKNWSTAVHQGVVHSFTTVMHETGANIGFIVSKRGLQSGAEQYTENTNFSGMTYLEFQQRYFAAWWKRYFCPLIGDAADRLLQYTEDFNPTRDERYAQLTPENQLTFDYLRRAHFPAAMVFSIFNNPHVSPLLDTGTLLQVPSSLDAFKVDVLARVTPHIQWHCEDFRGLLGIILEYLTDAEKEFNDLFGEYVFDLLQVTEVTIEGPPLRPLDD